MRRAQSITLAIATLCLSGCASFWSPETVTTRDGQVFQRPVWTTDGLYLANIDGPGALFLAAPPLDLFTYPGVYVDAIQVHTKQGHPRLDDAEQQWVRSYVRRELARVFERNGWRIVDAPGPGVLRLRVDLDEIEFRRRVFHDGTSVLNPSGGIEIALELRDSLVHQRVLLFADKRLLPMRSYSGSQNLEVRRIGWAFVEFGIDLERRIDQLRRGRFRAPIRRAGG